MKKSSPLQLETMVTFMEEHGDLSKPSSNSRGKIQTLKSWEELTTLLNSDGNGDTKPLDKWKKVWSDLKNNTKKKAARLHRAASGTGGGPATYAKLTDLEQRVLNLIGQQVATGLAVEEAGLSQDLVIDVNIEALAAAQDESQVEGSIELWNQPGPSNQVHVVSPATFTPHTQAYEENELEGREEMQQPPLTQPVAPELQPALSGQTVAQGSPRRLTRGTPRRLDMGSPRVNRGSPRRQRRRSPRLARPARTDEAAQHFLNSDREWRQFRMEQHRDHMDLRREQNRIREMELEVSRQWQAVATRGLEILEKFVNSK